MPLASPRAPHCPAQSARTILSFTRRPALSKARSAAQLVACASNVRQVGIAFIAYAANHRNQWPALYDATNPYNVWTFEGVRLEALLVPYTGVKADSNWIPSVGGGAESGYARHRTSALARPSSGAMRCRAAIMAVSRLLMIRSPTATRASITTGWSRSRFPECRSGWRLRPLPILTPLGHVIHLLPI